MVARALAAAATAAVVFGAPASAAPSLCAPNESVIFTCSVGAKIASICATPAVSPTQGFVAYRFGRPGAPDMSFQNRAGTRAGTWTFSGGGGAYLRFNRGAASYVVYSALGRGWGTKTGVAVLHNGKLIANLRCHPAPATDELGPDFFARAGIADDEKTFDLP